MRFLSVNVAELDAYKHAAVALLGDARVSLEELQAALGAWQVSAKYAAEVRSLKQAWEEETDRVYQPSNRPTIGQAEVIGILNDFAGESGVVVCAAGSLPGDLHKLWRTRSSAPISSVATLSTTPTPTQPAAISTGISSRRWRR